MLLLQHVMVHHLRVVQVGLIKLIARSGTLMEGVRGTLAMLVLRLIILMSQRVNQDTLAVLTRLRIVVVYEMRLLVLGHLGVLGVVMIVLL